jgi:alkylation response protein AidB-like acyl-CoA dehydrogenase
MALTTATAPLLTPDLLARLDGRAAGYDRDNRFFTEDFEDLRAAGYLLAAVPVRHGGSGLGLAPVMDLQQRLAYHAPATALALNMHLYWTGLAAELQRWGDDRLAWLLEEAAAGQVFATGHGEPGNDLGVFASNCTAERVEGGWVVTGRKVFGSLSPVWTYLGVHAMDTSDPERPVVIHGFLPRDAAGYRIEETWDALGMRATASHDTVLDGAFLPDHLVPVTAPAGPGGAELFHLALLAWAMLGFGAVYRGLAHRAYDEVVAGAVKRTAMGLTRTLAHHPEIQRAVAEMRMDLEALDAFHGRVCADWSAGVDHGGDWPLKIMAAKHFAVTRAAAVTDRALDVTGGAGVFKHHPVERLFRDARMGGFHPVNRLAVHEEVGKIALGVDPAEGARWG